MRITDLLNKESMSLHSAASTKEEVYEILMDLHDKNGNIVSKEGFREGIMQRESLGPTAITDGICIPHTKCDAVIKPGLAAVTIPAGIDCDAMDGEPSKLFFMIAAPATGSDLHLEVLSRLSIILMDPVVREELLATTDQKEFLNIIDRKEMSKFGEERKEEKQLGTTAKQRKLFSGVFGKK